MTERRPYSVEELTDAIAMQIKLAPAWIKRDLRDKNESKRGVAEEALGARCTRYFGQLEMTAPVIGNAAGPQDAVGCPQVPE